MYKVTYSVSVSSHFEVFFVCPKRAEIQRDTTIDTGQHGVGVVCGFIVLTRRNKEKVPQPKSNRHTKGIPQYNRILYLLKHVMIGTVYDK